MNSAISRICKKAIAKIMNRESGFTLTELAIGMLVVGILASVAVPSFLGARNNAYDKEAQASLIAVLNAADILYANQGDYSDASSAGCGSGAGASTALAADIQKLEPGIDAVAATSSSTNPLTVSVDANTTWSSNSESLGCQAFYATALSRSGNCWIVRKTVEGKFLSSGTTLPIQMAAPLNTQNAAVATWTLLQVNGAAFAYIRARSTGADADNTNGLAAVATACKAATQGTGSAGSTANVIKSTEFYTSWKDVQAGANGSNS